MMYGVSESGSLADPAAVMESSVREMAVLGEGGLMIVKGLATEL